MKSVLLTRPRPASAKLAVRLTRLGYHPVIEPLLEITPTHTPIPDIKGIGGIIITSANALMMSTTNISTVFSLPCYCVGDETALQARTVGFRNVLSANGDGSALADMIAHDDHAPRTLLHISGRDVASLARERLQQAGFIIVSWPVYAAKQADVFHDEVLKLWRAGDLKVVLAFSARTAEALKTLIIKHRLEACCHALIGIGISESATAPLRGLTWQQLAVAAQPTEDAVMQRLQELLPVAREP